MHVRVNGLRVFFDLESARLVPDWGDLPCPAVPVENQHQIAASIPPEPVRGETFEGGCHGLAADAPERTLNPMREFVALEKTA